MRETLLWEAPLFFQFETERRNDMRFRLGDVVRVDLDKAEGVDPKLFDERLLGIVKGSVIDPQTNKEIVSVVCGEGDTVVTIDADALTFKADLETALRQVLEEDFGHCA